MASPHDADLPPYSPVGRTDTLVRCNRCGSVVEGDVLGQNMHDIWHQRLDRPVRDSRLNRIG
jgi:hypothetical protein